MADRPLLMVIDDERAILDLLRVAAESDGWRVTCCSDPREALEIAGREIPDILLFDLIMPHLGGIEICRHLRGDARFEDSVAILMTGKVEPAERSREIVRGLEAGADDYLIKPFAIEELLARLQSWLRVKRSRDDLTAVAREAGEIKRQTEARYRRLFEQSNDAILVHTLDGRILDVNDQACRMLGYDKPALLALAIAALHPEGSLSASEGAVRAAGEEGSVRFESRFKRADGTVIDVEISSRLADREQGIVQGLVRDITGRKRAGEKLRREQAYNQAILSSMADALIVISEDGSVKHLNQRALAMLGYDREEVIGHSIGKLFAKSEKASASDLARIRSGLRGGEIRDLDTLLKRADGVLLAVSLSCALLPGASGETSEIVLIARDITDRQRLQEEQRKYAERLEAEVLKRTEDIRRSQARYRVLFEDVDHAIVTTDPEGGITSCNAAAERFFSRSEGEVVGEAVCASMCGKPDCPELASVLTGVRESGAWTHECFAGTDKGRDVPVHCSASAIRDESGMPQGMIWVITDLSLAEEAHRAQEYAEIVLRTSGPHGELIGKGDAHQRIARFVTYAAPAPSPVLIMGESGTGKEVVARAIHLNGPRAEKPFVVVDCAALKGELLESELFGYDRGAFTGATASRAGFVEVADGGTLFADEIGEMPVELQSKLLRVLERGEFTRLGSTRERKADIRVIAATNRDLAVEMKKGGFRNDLYYRLNVLSIELPRLCERVEDISLLARHFLENSRVTMSGKKRFGRGTLRRLEAYDWPGNIRELANVVERAIILSGQGLSLTPAHLPPEVQRAGGPTPSAAARSLAEVEGQAIEVALKVAEGNKTRAAEILGITRGTLRQKMSKYKIRK